MAKCRGGVNIPLGCAPLLAYDFSASHGAKQ